MRFTSAVFILTQILLSLTTKCLMAESGGPWQTRRQSQKQQLGIDRKSLRNMISHPTNRKKVALMSYHKYYLVMINGKLQGSKERAVYKEFGKFELQSFDVGVVRIFNVKARKFIAVDKNGRAYATRNNTKDTLFKETQKNSLFVTFYSLKNRGRRKWYLAITKRGKLKRPSRTFSRHRSIEFLAHDWGKHKLHLNSR